MPFPTFPFLADTIDGRILEFPKLFYLECDLVKPLGLQIIRQYSKTQCIVAKKVFQIYYAGQVFGSTQFTSVMQFVQYLNSVCVTFCTPAYFTINNCLFEINGCDVTIYNPCPDGYSFTLYGCSATINDCQLVMD